MTLLKTESYKIYNPTNVPFKKKKKNYLTFQKKNCVPNPYYTRRMLDLKLFGNFLTIN